MRNLFILAAFLVSGAFLVSAVIAAPFRTSVPEKVSVLKSEWVEEIFIDYRYDPSHAGPGPHPTTESDNFHLTQGGISWFASTTAVEYSISGTEAATSGNTAIENAEATWDVFITNRTFTRNDDTTQINPCTTTSSVVQWAAIDGPGDALASARVCRNVVTKEIAGFVITVDTAESWSTGATSTTAFDVENVVSHEFGHVAGLSHVNGWQNGCLTMFTFAQEGETQKRTLGLGDKLGMDALYSTGDTSAGPGCSE